MKMQQSQSGEHTSLQHAAAFISRYPLFVLGNYSLSLFPGLSAYSSRLVALHVAFEQEKENQKTRAWSWFGWCARLSCKYFLKKLKMYLLKCSVCRGEFQRKDDWTKHLFSNTHQSKARAKCNSWNNEMKDCAIVVYCQFPVPSPSGHKLLRYLSKELSTFVTDFVWRDSNPRVAIVQFESRLGTLTNASDE